MNLIDRDELRRRIVESLDYHDRESSVDMDGWKACKAILDDMPTLTCETCRRGDDDQGKDQCRGTLLREASMCNFYEPREP